MKFLNLFISAQLLVSISFAQIKINPIVSSAGLAIKAQRTISFTTNEGSYLDVDISPDGSTILFSCLGELFSLPAKGGVATQLTRGLAINRCPLWSPNGKLISYESDATGFVKLHVTNLAGSFHKVLDVDSYHQSLTPIWFPDSKQVAIYDKAYHLTGMTSYLPQKMQNTQGFSQDGRFVFFQEFISRDSSVFVKYDRLKHEQTTLLGPNRRYFNNAKVSPDGNWFTYIKYERVTEGVYTPADSLMAIDLKTGKEKLLAHLNITFTSVYLDRQHSSFSKDSKYLFIGYGGKIHRIEIETGKNDIIPFTANVNLDMGAFDYNRFRTSLDSVQVKYIRSVQRSPDGKHLVFSALNKIYVQDLPNGKPHILVDQISNQFQPVYSPDGKWICYVSWSDNDGGYLWRVPSIGGKPEQLTSVPSLYQHPSWSPDGKMIVVIKGSNKLGLRDYPGDGQLQIISINKDTVKVIADEVSLFNQPVFSKAGAQIVFTPNQRQRSKKIWPWLVSKDVGSKAETVLAYAKDAGSFLFPTIRQTLLSPDGQYLIFVYNENIYVVPMANIGGAQTIFDKITPVQLIRFGKGVDPVWEKGGKVLSWIDGTEYCSIQPEKIIEAARQLSVNKTLNDLPETKIIDVHIPPDHLIPIHFKVPRLYGNNFLVLKNARIVTMHGNEVIENGTAIIKDGRFVKIGQSNEIKIPREATIMDMSGETIIPGLIDMHSHMYEAVPADIFLQQSWQRLLEFSYGVTTMRDPSGSFDTFGYSEMVETGQAIGPRLLTVGRAVRPEFYNVNSLEEAKIIVNNRVKYGATYIKQYIQPTRLQRELLLQACKQAGVNMTNEVEKEPLYCLGMIKDGSTGVEHNPIWGEVNEDVIKLASKSETYLCPTLQVCYGREEGKHYFHKFYGQDFINRSSRFMSDDYRKQLEKEIKEDVLDTGFLLQSRIDARIKHAGGKIVMGSHGEDQGIGAHWEIWALQMGGLTNHEALETATITAAEALGMQRDLGSIEVGKIADLIILDKNPLEDIHNTNTIKYVMKAGVLYEADTLNEVWPERKPCPDWRMKSEVQTK